jgi:hypothetical protein
MPTPTLKYRTDYYPFVSSIKSRGYSAGSGFRFGFNTQEKDKEIYKNIETYTATFWEYDGRLGRRWNVDAIVKLWTQFSLPSNFAFGGSVFQKFHNYSTIIYSFENIPPELVYMDYPNRNVLPFVLAEFDLLSLKIKHRIQLFNSKNISVDSINRPINYSADGTSNPFRRVIFE